MTKLIYQSPKKEKKLSQPINEADARSRQILEDKGWKVVGRIGDEGEERVPESQASGKGQPVAPDGDAE